MKEIERAINLISEGEIDYSGIYDCELNERVTEVILNALREQAEREKGCGYCKGNAKELVDGDTTIFIDQEDKVFCADWGGSNYLAWEYCPMCGRRLEGKS